MAGGSNKAQQLVALAVALSIPLAGGALVGAATRPAMQRGGWLASLKKPKWYPPAVVFPVVWTALYAAMGLASWLVWRQAGSNPGNAGRALGWYAAQLALNLSWPFAFFSAQSVPLGLAVIVALGVALIRTPRRR